MDALTNVRDQVAALQCRLSREEKGRSVLQEELIAQQKKNAELEQQVLTLKAELALATSETESLRTLVATMNANLASCRTLYEEEVARVRKVSNEELTRLQARYTGLQQQVDIFKGQGIDIALAAMDLVLVPGAVDSGAVCLDGTAPGYYYKPYTNEADKNKWVLFFQGGGWCYKESDCLERTKTETGSSNNMPLTLEDGGPLAEDVDENPEFAGWNHVEFAYCDGASFSGDLAEPVVVDGTPLYFRGFRVLKALMQDLLDNKGLDQATDVMLLGCSAGGMSVYLHADQIRDMLPKTVTRYKVSPFSGFFLNVDNVMGDPVFPDQLRYVYEMQNASAGVPQKCLQNFAPEDQWKCFFAEEAYKVTESPILVSNSIYDSWSTYCVFAADYVVPASSINGNCTPWSEWNCLYSRDCSEELIEDLNTKWGDHIIERVTKVDVAAKDGNGYFLYACSKHCAEDFGSWNKVAVDGLTIRQAFVKWWESDNDPSSLHQNVDCRWTDSFFCNPTCA